MVGQDAKLYGSAMFYFLPVLAPVIAMLPDFLWTVWVARQTDKNTPTAHVFKLYLVNLVEYTHWVGMIIFPAPMYRWQQNMHRSEEEIVRQEEKFFDENSKVSILASLFACTVHVQGSI